MDVPDKISQGDIDAWNSIFEQYNEALDADDDIQKAILIGGMIEHSLSTLHFDMIQRVNNLTKKLQ